MKVISVRLVIILNLNLITAFYLKINDWVNKRTESDYIRCLNRTEGNDFKLIAETHLVSVGSALSLKCNNLCLNYSESVENLWTFKAFNNLSINSIYLREKGIKINKNLSLEIDYSKQNATYFCISGGKIHAIHDITVVKNEKFHFKLREKNSTKKRFKAFHLKDRNLLLFSDWTQWSQCNQCNKIGIRKKVGICKIKKITNFTVSPKSISILDKEFFDSGIPCRSNHLPENILSLKEVKERKSEIEYSFCNISCPQTNIKGLKNIIREWSDFKFNRIYTYELQTVIISCSQCSDEFKHYIWKKITFSMNTKNTSYVINAMSVHNRTKGRIKIDFMNNLIIRKVLKIDGGYYGCYEFERQISLTKLEVRVSSEKQLSIFASFATQFIIFLIAFIIITFGVSLWKNRGLKTKR